MILISTLPIIHPPKSNSKIYDLVKLIKSAKTGLKVSCFNRSLSEIQVQFLIDYND